MYAFTVYCQCVLVITSMKGCSTHLIPLLNSPQNGKSGAYTNSGYQSMRLNLLNYTPKQTEVKGESSLLIRQYPKFTVSIPSSLKTSIQLTDITY